MSVIWDGAPPPEEPRIGPLGWVRIALRGILILVTILLGLTVLLPLRLIERPFFGAGRPLSPWVTQAVCRMSLLWMGLSYGRTGRPMTMPGAVVANHSSWLDIFVLNASDRVYFVSKSEVAAWPGIGLLARVTGTVFIARDRREAKAQTALFQARMEQGHRLLFFPEGTSTDGLRVLPFKTTLFEAFFAPGLREVMWVQPVSVTYHAPNGAPVRLYGWWGEMEFGPHLLVTLAQPRQGRVEVVYHDPIRVAEMRDRKALAAAAQAAVLAGHGLAGVTHES